MIQNIYGINIKQGYTLINKTDWNQIINFIDSNKFYHNELFYDQDKLDLLLQNNINYGTFILGFDFHLTSKGPKLIEINTNPGGLVSAFHLNYDFGNNIEKKFYQIFLDIIHNEFNLANLPNNLQNIAIVDNNITQQYLYPEMVYMSNILKKSNLNVVLCSPEELKLNLSNQLVYGKTIINMIYNRLTDFRLIDKQNEHIRLSVLANMTVITPHPAAYVRVSDKLLLTKINDPIVPLTIEFKNYSYDYWKQNKKKYVFKPSNLYASKGVFIGKTISNKCLLSLGENTIVQEYCQPGSSDDGTKYDLRVYCYKGKVICYVARHFTKNIMELSMPSSGFRKVKIE